MLDTTENQTPVTMTPVALAKATELQQGNPDWQNLSLRIYLDGKGCDGFYYGVTFDRADSKDLHFVQQGVDLICDPATFQFVWGASIDWVDGEHGQGFLVDNPRQKHFRGKFFKRSAWKEVLTRET